MSTMYIFNEAGSIPGIPGSFANVSVTVNDDGSTTIVPLSQHPAFVPSGTPEEVMINNDEVGVVDGIPGTFADEQVNVDASGNVTQEPLPEQPTS